MARKSMATWINEALTNPDKEGRISAISMVHMIGQQRGPEMHTVRIQESGNYDGAVLEKVFRGKAETFSQDLDGVQTFALLAFYGGKNIEQDILPFKVLPQVDPATAGLTTEPPTPEGRLMQRMRWEDTQQTQVAALQMQVYNRQRVMDDHSIRMMERMDAMLARSQSMCETLMRENGEAFTIVKELLNDKAIGQHNRQMEALEFQRATKEREAMLKFAPALINTVLGKEIFPQSTADTALIETIAENLEPEHVAKLAELNLPPQLMGPLAARISKAMDDKEKREAEANRRLPSFKGDPEADVNGGSK